jgi:hypothetical protein
MGVHAGAGSSEGDGSGAGCSTGGTIGSSTGSTTMAGFSLPMFTAILLPSSAIAYSFDTWPLLAELIGRLEI